MPGCAAIGCNNRSEKGFTMKCFPRDPVLRKIWKKRVGRADWEPSNNSFLCTSHFDKTQWFRNSSGKIKLKKDAIPSIFKITSTRKSPKKKQKVDVQSLEDTDLDQYEIEYLDNSSPLFLNLASQKTLPNIINIQSQNAEITGQILQNISILSSDALKNFQNENIIIVADEHNREIGKIIKDNSFVLLEDIRNKENLKTQSKPEKSTSGVVKVEVKEEVHENSLQEVDFDALEKKLEAICHETDSNNSKDSFKTIKNQSTSARSSFSLEDLENASVIECDTRRMPLKRKRENRTDSSSEEVIIVSQKTSQLSSKNEDKQTDQDARDIINDLEMEELEECEVAPKTQLSVAKSNQGNASKIIIKDNIDLSNKSVTVLPVNSKKNDVNVKTVNNVDKVAEKLLAAKVEMQAEVIQKLTNQLIMYKDLESHVKRLTGEVEVKNKEIKVLMGKVTANNLHAEKKAKINSSLQDASKSDLIERVMELESQVKSLTKSTNEEIKNRKQMECKVRCKENCIKELNWKLDKAAKILQRTEKNMNNYKKRMYDTKAVLKRNNLLNSKISRFDKIFTCNESKEFTDGALKAALEIKEACGLQGYQKLLDYSFPLPSLRLLNRKSLIIKQEGDDVNDEVININDDDDDDNDDDEPVMNIKQPVHDDSKPIETNKESVEKNKKFVERNAESVKNSKDHIEYNDYVENNEESVECNNLSDKPGENTSEFMESNMPVKILLDETDDDEDVKMEEVEYLDPEFLNKPNETMVQTVQDIFNDCSDDEDFIELKKHILKEELVDDFS